MRVATISAGYADGYRRSLSNREAAVLIGGRRCPVLGRVTMDLTMVDVSAVPGVKPGDEVVLIGKQGREEILVAEVAEARRDGRMGDFYRHWQPGAESVSLIRELRFEIR
jgi:alanine racemase